MVSPATLPSTVTLLPAKAFSFSGLETLKIFVPTMRTAGEPMPMHFLAHSAWPDVEALAMSLWAHMESETTPWKVSAIALTDKNERLKMETASSFFMGETSGGYFVPRH